MMKTTATLLVNQSHKLFQRDDIHFRKGYGLENIVVVVVRNDIFRISTYSAINKLVVVWIGSYQIESKCGVDKLNESTFQNCVNNKLSNALIGKSAEHLCVFFYYLVCYTKYVLARQNTFPDFMEWAVCRDATNKAIGVKDNTHHVLFCYIFTGFLFPKPLMEIHFIDFVKPLLVKNPRIPQSVKFLLQLVIIILADKVTDVIEFLFRFNMRENSQQILLCWSVNSCFHKILFNIKYPVAKIQKIPI